MKREKAPRWLTLKNVELCLERAELVRHITSTRKFIQIADMCEKMIHELQPGASVAEFFAECDEDDQDLLRVALGFVIAENHARDGKGEGHDLAKVFLAKIDAGLKKAEAASQRPH